MLRSTQKGTLIVGALLSSVSPLIAISYISLKTAHMTCYIMLCNSSSFVLRPTQLSGVVFLICMWREPKKKNEKCEI